MHSSLMSHTINDQSQETVCDWCGRPLYAGDKVYTDGSERYAFCTPQDQRAFARQAADHWSNADYINPIRSLPGFVLDAYL